jgi:hypothetical protein
MTKKSHADIMEKLSALRPSEPTKTRGTVSRKTAQKKKVNIRAVAETPVQPVPRAVPPPSAVSKESVVAMGQGFCSPFGNAAKVYLDAHDCWFKMIRNTNRLFLDSLSCLWNLGSGKK